MRLLYVVAVCCLVVSRLGSFTAAAGSEEYTSRWQYFLAEANGFYEEEDWLLALRCYGEARAERPDLPNDDEICYRMARCSELAIPLLRRLLPAPVHADSVYGPQAMGWLQDTYGYYVQVSEGAPWWMYDKRALRELLRLHPESSYADEAEYVLTKYELVLLERNPIQIVERYPEVVERYERLLERYPDTNLRPTILQELAFLKDPGGEHAEWIRDYWHSAYLRYP